LITIGTLGLAPRIGAQVVDSLLPIEEEIRRFGATIPKPASRLEGGAASRDGLIRAFARGVEARDSVGLARLLIGKAEFAGLYYPTSRYTHSPYRQKPSLVWFLMTSASARGMGRVLARDGGRPLGYRGYRCRSRPVIEGKNRIWQGCEISVTTGHRRLFGAIIERGGWFKFLTYDSEY
jgi:hypothetical protein